MGEERRMACAVLWWPRARASSMFLSKFWSGVIVTADLTMLKTSFAPLRPAFFSSSVSGRASTDSSIVET